MATHTMAAAIYVQLEPTLTAEISAFVRKRGWTIDRFITLASSQCLAEYARQEVRRRTAGQPEKLRGPVSPQVPTEPRDRRDRVCPICDMTFTPYGHGYEQAFCSRSHMKYAQRYGSIEAGRERFQVTQQRRAVTR
jgi:hypothetical protein